MTYDQKIKRLDESDDVGAIQTFLIQTVFIIQKFVQDNRDNEPIQDWSYQKVVDLIQRGALK
jgi:hypothetical protein